jgi:hypothetical protein
MGPNRRIGNTWWRGWPPSSLPQKTVKTKTHLSHIFAKLDVQDRTQAVTATLDRGIPCGSALEPVVSWHTSPAALNITTDDH